MKKLLLLTLVCCTIFIACTKNNTETELQEVDAATLMMQQELDNIAGYLDFYIPLEDAIIEEAKEDLNKLYTLYLGHLNLISESQSLTSPDINEFISTYKVMSNEEILETLSATDFVTEIDLNAFKGMYNLIENLPSVEARVEALSSYTVELELNEAPGLVAQVAARYSALLTQRFQLSSENANSRDCMSECRWHNVYYGAYYASYYSYLNQCGGYCYNEAAAYAHDCGILACMNFCN